MSELDALPGTSMETFKALAMFAHMYGYVPGSGIVDGGSTHDGGSWLHDGGYYPSTDGGYAHGDSGSYGSDSGFHWP